MQSHTEQHEGTRPGQGGFPDGGAQLQQPVSDQWGQKGRSQGDPITNPDLAWAGRGGRSHPRPLTSLVRGLSSPSASPAHCFWASWLMNLRNEQDHPRERAGSCNLSYNPVPASLPPTATSSSLPFLIDSKCIKETENLISRAFVFLLLGNCHQSWLR